MFKNNNIKILSTLGPSSLNERVISRLSDLNVDLFRINLSHTSINELPKVIKLIKSFTSIPICLDTEGAQVRTGKLDDKIVLKENEYFKIKKGAGTGNSKWLNLYPEVIYDVLEIGDILTIDFNSVLVQVVEKNHLFIVVRVLTGGLMQQNKAVTINKNITLPPLTEKDIESIKLGLQYGISHFALSFANASHDVEQLRELVGEESSIISKIESINGLKNIDEISLESDALLIDRGDLSQEIPIEKIPNAQKYIINTCKKNNKQVFVATNLLETMINSVNPTRAEVNDIHNTLCDGANGLVLAAETAIGQFPVQCATMIRKMITQFENSTNHKLEIINNLVNKESLILPRPHGGSLVSQVIDNKNLSIYSDYKVITTDLTTIMDAEQIAIGTFSPITGFMNKDEIESVLDNYKLQSGEIWPLPIMFQTEEQFSKSNINNETVVLKLKGSDVPYIKMYIEGVFSYDLDKLSKKLFGTNDKKHPGVFRLFEKGNQFISGKVELINRLPSIYKPYEFTPAETRNIFENKGWSRVVGFHTRNIPHRVHEFIQEKAINENFCDGIFIHPVIGPKKTGDFLPEFIINSYNLLIDDGYLNGKCFLGGFQSYSRYAGPREAIFTALCRKNFGCSHFILGRDHTGVGNYYSKDDFNIVLSKLEDLGITPLIFDEYIYSQKRNNYINRNSLGKEKLNSISGTEARELLNNNQKPPSWYMRKEISSYIINALNSGKEVFVH